LQAKNRTPVIDQVELDVATAAIQLELSLTVTVGMILAIPNNRAVGWQEAVAGRPQKLKTAIEPVFVDVIKEQPTDTTRLIAVLQEKILVTPGLVARVEVITKRIARRFGGLVPVNDIFFERIVRRQVEPATEPPDRP